MNNTPEKIGIIGGGLGGLAAACTLAARGYSVVLFERNDWLGGKAAVLERDGFRFDMGPTILTVPSVLHRIFGEANRRLALFFRGRHHAGLARKRGSHVPATRQLRAGQR